jgi:hypothetical protein
MWRITDWLFQASRRNTKRLSGNPEFALHRSFEPLPAGKLHAAPEFSLFFRHPPGVVLSNL